MEPKKVKPSPSQESMDAVSFADSLASNECSMRSRFISLFTSAMQKKAAPTNLDTGKNQTNNTLSDNKSNDDQDGPENVQNNEEVDVDKSKEVVVEDGKKEMNLTSSIAHFLKDKFNIGQRLSSLVDLVVPDFSPESTIFHSPSAEIDDFFGTHRDGDKFLDLFSVEAATQLIKNSPIGPALEELGYDDWYIEYDLSDCFMHYAYLRSRSIPDQSKFLGMMIVQKGEFRLKSITNRPNTNSDLLDGLTFVHEKFPQDSKMLNIRWFALQNPRAHFSASKPRLPGQRFPGTGLARSCFSIFCDQALKNSRDGIINVPEHFHNALLYEKFMFLNPSDEGEFEKMKLDLDKDINERGISSVSWAIYLGFLRKNGELTKWDPHEQVFPLSKKLFKYFNSTGYKDIVKEKLKQKGKYSINWDEAEGYCLSAVIKFNSDSSENSSNLFDSKFNSNISSASDTDGKYSKKNSNDNDNDNLKNSNNDVNSNINNNDKNFYSNDNENKNINDNKK
ncbi:hypothetical protein M9Y10_015055 [Tritrichomonas musculus]|uniref:Initiator binding domain-containing protein n=1 Tax=Tritrichomonas musculus TaxID=1915356 RepID=A0ABR2L2A3_9EUKA